MYGMYKKLARENTGTFTGKGLSFGGSLIRPEATGFGALYYVVNVLKDLGTTIEGKTIAISGFGNVAWGAATKAVELGGKVVTISGPDGYIYDRPVLTTRRSPICLNSAHQATMSLLLMQISSPAAHSMPARNHGSRRWISLCPVPLRTSSWRGCQGSDCQWRNALCRGFQHGLYSGSH